MAQSSQPLALTDAELIETNPRRFAELVIRKLIDQDAQISRESPEYGVVREGGILPRRTIDVAARGLSVGLLVNYTEKLGVRRAGASTNIPATHVIESVANGIARLSAGYASGPVIVDTAAATDDGVLFLGEAGSASKAQASTSGYTDQEVGRLVGTKQSGLCKAKIAIQDQTTTVP